jgi:hypothetical protein
MPTDVIKSIGTGGDYTTIQAWEDASPADLTTADQRWIGELKNQTFTAGVIISGTTVDSTRYTILRCGTGSSFRDNITGSGPLKYDTTKGAAIQANVQYLVDVQQNYTQLSGLQIRRTSYDQALRFSSTASNCTATNCVVSSGPNGEALRTNQPSNVFRNCLLICEGGTNAAVSGQGSLYNCTVVRSTTAGGTGVTSSYSSLLLQDTAVFGFSTVFTGTLKTGTQYNATDGVSIGGNTGDVTSLTYSSQFASTTNDWRALSSGGLKAGTPDASTTTDIIGTTRDATTPYIGAWEVAAAVSTPTGWLLDSPPPVRMPIKTIPY